MASQPGEWQHERATRPGGPRVLLRGADDCARGVSVVRRVQLLWRQVIAVMVNDVEVFPVPDDASV